MKQRQTFKVSCDHGHSDYQFRQALVQVCQNHDGTWFADHPWLGCGHDKGTAYDAIIDLFQAHGCYRIKIED
jgi:hypothetical protein